MYLLSTVGRHVVETVIVRGLIPRGRPDQNRGLPLFFERYLGPAWRDQRSASTAGTDFVGELNTRALKLVQPGSDLAPLLPNKPRSVPRVDDRRVLNGIFWVLRSGSPWRAASARPPGQRTSPDRRR
jgi:hypothetical protein